MECLALSCVKFSVTSGDPALGKAQMVVQGHPKATVARLVEYLSSQLDEEQQRAVGDAGLELLRDGRPLDGETLLQTVALYQDAGIIDLELRKTELEGFSLGRKNGFDTTNVEIHMNSFSEDKILEFTVRDLAWSTTLMDLQRMALEKLQDYENDSQSKTFCDKDYHHDISCFRGFMFKGKKEPVYYDDEEDMKTSEELTLRDYLQIDFTPANSSFFKLAFKVKHRLAAPEDYKCEIELISNAHLFMHKLYATSETVVNDVKTFITCVYMESLAISIADVKLICNGKMINDLDEQGNQAKIIDSLHNLKKVKIHVQITKDHHEMEIEFWDNLFADCMDSSTSTKTRMEPTKTITEVKIPQEQPEELFEEIEPKITRYEFLTENNEIIKPTGIFYEKCTIDDGQEVLIERSNFETKSYELHIADAKLKISGQDYVVDGNHMMLAPSLIARLEEKYGFEILKENHISTISVSLEEELNSMQNSNGTSHSLPSVSTMAAIFFMLLRTLYVIGINSIAPIFILLQFVTILPYALTVAATLFFVFRVLWNTQEIWDLWKPYIRRNRRITTQQYIAVKKCVNSEELTLNFYQQCENDRDIIDCILTPTAFQDYRIEAYENASIADVSENNGAETLKLLFHKVASKEEPKLILDKLFTKCMSHYRVNQVEFTDDEDLITQDALKEIIAKIHRSCAKEATDTSISQHQPIYIRVLQFVVNLHHRVTTLNLYTTAIRKIVPNPNTDSLVMGIVKNFFFCILVLLPPIKTAADTIIRENEQQGQLQE